jgi:phosphatidylserine/phosphatidylglycerophosphate/cardiolipin synthase-like enzyme
MSWKTYVALALLVVVEIALAIGCGWSGGSGGGGGGGDGEAHDVSIVVEPNGNDGAEVIDAIRASTGAVDVEIYELDDSRVIAALADRARAGVAVSVVLDGSSAGRAWNAGAATKLTAAGAVVVWSSSAFAYTHTKLIVIDNAVAWIMTMNLDYSSPADNREYLVEDREPADVAEASAVILADLAGLETDMAGSLVVANANARTRIGELIAGATRSLDVEVEELTDPAIAQLLADAAARGVRVRVALAGGTLAAWDRDVLAPISAAGGTVVQAGADVDHRSKDGAPYLHAKLIAIDGVRAFVGSENLSPTSLDHNREVGVVIADPAALAILEQTFDDDLAMGASL